MRPTLMPLGWRLSSVISPTGSGMAAICSQPSATVSMICGVSFSRSSSGAARPAARAASRSSAFACCNAAEFARSRAARPRSASFLAAVEAAAMTMDAARAATPTWAM